MYGIAVRLPRCTCPMHCNLLSLVPSHSPNTACVLQRHCGMSVGVYKCTASPICPSRPCWSPSPHSTATYYVPSQSTSLFSQPPPNYTQYCSRCLSIQTRGIRFKILVMTGSLRVKVSVPCIPARSYPWRSKVSLQKIVNIPKIS